ncbi:thioesterase II family protein [Rhodovulum sulfidophilum]|uniref:Thioesterase n=1 Tax=Rhodovulum sulfidophilum TaxID=35806 RepID=A0ABS1RRX0_RHOSU|nr:alpha/beta fold hydrolase [Rhodovulum sulfidophilum]MBL3608801.1 thioesterase [Rhodovulum sulfidophilum]
MTSTDWLIRGPGRTEARLRLFLFPFAGGGASIYRGWAEAAPGDVEVIRVQPPGRENRAAEPALDSVEALAKGFIGAALPAMDRPFALFGHSLGSMVAFRAAALLRERPQGARLCRLFVSGARPPHLPDPEPIHGLPDPAFREALRARGGTPDAILDDAGMFSFFAPTLRRDLRAAETWFDPDAPAPGVPLVVLNGRGDRVVKAESAGVWARYASTEPGLHEFDGGHFFVQARGAEVREAVFAELSRGPGPRDYSACRSATGIPSASPGGG